MKAIEKRITVNLYDYLDNGDRRLTYINTEVWEYCEYMYCPYCGGKNVWVSSNEDYNAFMNLRICTNCKKTWTQLRGSTNDESIDRRNQRLKQLKS